MQRQFIYIFIFSSLSLMMFVHSLFSLLYLSWYLFILYFLFFISNDVCSFVIYGVPFYIHKTPLDFAQTHTMRELFINPHMKQEKIN